MPVRFSGQTNLIVWDAKRGIEHFVRDAQFTTKGASLGFIAPTPGRPTLSGVDKRVFSDIAALQPIVLPAAGAVGSKDDTRSMDREDVVVVETKDVAGYRATVLQARNARSLTTWLKQNGYPSAPWVTRWTQPYVQKGWYLTAFKVLPHRGRIATGPVRMSFRTDRPFNPYSVPAENTGRSPLRLYYLSAGAEEPREGGTKRWLAPKWRAAIPDSMRPTLAKALHLPPSQLPSGLRVTTYVDEAFSRPGRDDLFFVPARRVATRGRTQSEEASSFPVTRRM